MDKKRLKSIIINAILIILFIIVVSSGPMTMQNTEITYDEFLTMVDEGKVDTVEIGTSELTITQVGSNVVYHTGIVDNDELVKTLYDAGVKFSQVPEQSYTIFDIILSILFNFGPLILMIWFFVRMFSSQNKNGMGGIFSIGKSKATLNVNKDTGVKFEDVAGQEEAKEQLTEIIDFLHNSKKYQDIGAKIPKGALLVGPPGTGKTLLAKAVAGEAGVPFFYVTGSDFIEMYVGVGASRVRDLFEQAKKNAPCIIFIDEVDAIAKTRDSARGGGGNDERDQTLNQLLSEMDGFDSSTGVIILAATNRPEILDKAFLRAGRFDRKIIVERPDFKGRVATLQVHSKNVKLGEDVDFKAIAYATAGSVGADLENIVNEAALRAVKFKRKTVMQEDFMEAIEVVFAGKEKKDRIMSDEEKRLVAYHEVGHAVVAAMQKTSSPIQKITIIPRTKGSLGYTLQVPEEEKFLSSKEEMLQDITTFLGGRCAEEVIFNKVTTGASNDIERATDIARQMITIYGMSDEFDMMALESIQNRYLDGSLVRNCSEQTSTKVDNAILKVIKECHANARKIIEENRDLMDAVAIYLLKKESITGEEFRDIFHRFHPEIELKVTTIDDLDKSKKTINLEKDDDDDYTPPRKKASLIRDDDEDDERPRKKVQEPKEEPRAFVEEEEEKTIRFPIKNIQQEEEEEEEYIPEPAPKKQPPQREQPAPQKPQKILGQEPGYEIAEAEPMPPFVPKPRVQIPDEIDVPYTEEAKKAEEKPPKPIRIDRQPTERPSASVLGPKKKKKKNKNKATASDMQNLLNSVQEQEQKKKLYDKSEDTDEIEAESAGTASKANPKDYANDDMDIDDITEDMF